VFRNIHSDLYYIVITSIVVDAIALGTALFMLSGIYIVGQSVRGSKKPDEVG